jgi:U2 small nuclear ribonucleoprotein B''
MATASTRAVAAPGTKGPKPTYAPNQTLYITNLPSSKIGKDDLRISLYTLFSTYGPVLDVVALRTMKMRGQAHVVFRDVQTATQAMRGLQSFDFFGKEMVSLYSCLPLFDSCISLNEFLGHMLFQVEIRHNCKAGWYISRALCRCW